MDHDEELSAIIRDVTIRSLRRVLEVMEQEGKLTTLTTETKKGKEF